MNNRPTLYGVLFILALNVKCTSPKYLPSHKEVDVNVYGSYIEIDHTNRKDVAGELIAIDANRIVLMPIQGHSCEVIPLSEINGFNLRYAKSKNYGWTIPVFTVFSLVHGGFAVLTLPLNLIITTAITASGQKAYLYNEKEISYKDLQMFARYPQGIPKGIELNQIRPSDHNDEIENEGN
jgi:hypothetical protein